MNIKKILITGASGYLGSNLSMYFTAKGHNVSGIINKNPLPYNPSHERIFDADITNYNEIKKIIAEIQPDIIIHTAALSDLSKCEGDKALAFNINVGGTRNIIKSIRELDFEPKLIFISSDYVFEGDHGDYKENERPNPKTVYGNTKLVSEDDIKKSLNDYIICRTANVYGDGGKFFNFLVSNLRNDNEISVYRNAIFTPTYIEYFLDSIERLIEKDYKGIIHITGNERLSRYDFSIKIADALNKERNLIRPVERPLNGLISKDSSLNSDYARGLLGNYVPSTEKSIYYCFKYLNYPYFYYEDVRGIFFGISQDLNWKEINYIESKKGSIRGAHYHMETLEGFYIIEGKIKISLNNLIDGTKRDFIASKGDFFVIGQNILHTFEMLADSRWINMLSMAMNMSNKDIYKLR